MMNNPDTSGVTLNAADATNPAATLGWLRDWLAADHDTLAASMRRHSCPWPCQSPRWWPGKVLAVVCR